MALDDAGQDNTELQLVMHIEDRLRHRLGIAGIEDAHGIGFSETETQAVNGIQAIF